MYFLSLDFECRHPILRQSSAWGLTSLMALLTLSLSASLFGYWMLTDPVFWNLSRTVLNTFFLGSFLGCFSISCFLQFCILPSHFVLIFGLKPQMHSLDTYVFYKVHLGGIYLKSHSSMTNATKPLAIPSQLQSKP